MAKTHRGKGTVEYANRGRGECPVCKRTALKAIYDIEAGEKKLKVCKQCKAGVKNGKLKEALASL